MRGQRHRTDYGPHKTRYNRFIHWSRPGFFDHIFAGLAGEGPKPEGIMIEATHLKAHHTAASLLKKEMFPPYRAHQGLAAHRNTLRSMRPRLRLDNLHRSHRHL